MTALALAFALGIIPVPPSPVHTPHICPANPQLTAAPVCVVKWSENRKLKIRVCWENK